MNDLTHAAPILVTGAAGHLGHLVAEALTADGCSLLLFDRFAPLRWGGPGERLVGDMADGATCERAVEEAAGIVHLAAPPWVTRIYPTETLRASLGWRPWAERPLLPEPPSVST